MKRVLKKILYITTDSWWDTDTTIIPQLSQDYDVEVFVASMAERNKNKFVEKAVPSNVKIHDFHIVRTQKNPLMLFASLFYLLRLILALPKSDYVFWVIDSIIYYSLPFSWFCPIYKTILSLHNYEEHIGGKRQLFDLKSYLLNRYKYFHFHSAIQKDLFLKDYKSKETFFTNMPLKYYGASHNSFSSIFPRQQRTFLFFGMIRDYKRPDMFLRSVNQFSNANFMIVGYTKTPSKYERIVTTNHQNFHANYTFVTNEQIADYFYSVRSIVNCSSLSCSCNCF